MKTPGGSLLGIIPARGGSKGIPGKNTRLLAGRPLLAYTVDAARQSGIFT
ncbi:MAG TPA: acylneuraminate cytidylyltransferase family protein, partial [Candidatus Paceibacterota bacterium]|nr:acylneuraminate cytidylyltransferase family protein [Candidatus Paceibacterota bacterium]